MEIFVIKNVKVKLGKSRCDHDWSYCKRWDVYKVTLSTLDLDLVEKG